jgi:hypothetical protein
VFFVLFCDAAGEEKQKEQAQEKKSKKSKRDNEQ